MKRFTDAVAKAVADKNWFAATALSLTMPDICGRMENPKDGSEKRYKAWWDKYMLEHYRGGTYYGPKRPLRVSKKAVFLSGADAYALRCAYLHEGRGNILDQRAREALTHFLFAAPTEGFSIHKIRQRRKGKALLILQVDIFCQDIIDAVGRWSNDVSTDQAVQQRFRSLLEVQ
jgi:hypothetical protein